MTYVAIAMHEILRICSRTDFTCFPRCPSLILGLHCKEHCHSLPSHSSWHWPSSEQFHMKEHVSLNLPSMTCHNLAHFYPTKHEILFMFSCKSKRNFLVVSPDPQLTATKITRAMQLHDSIKSPTSTTHMVWVQLNGTATIPKILKWPM